MGKGDNGEGYAEIENGMKLQVQKTILGHSNISMTMDLYSHVLRDEKAQEKLLMEDFVY